MENAESEADFLNDVEAALVLDSEYIGRSGCMLLQFFLNPQSRLHSFSNEGLLHSSFIMENSYQ